METAIFVSNFGMHNMLKNPLFLQLLPEQFGGRRRLGLAM